ncbi:MAG: hypothetical protein JWL92_37 [Candidatus Nomurabacteria bacterium]|nr:hypothetical protein [Candidatus Nomurabacteria bacterium]
MIINYGGAVLAAVAAFIIGFLFHGPLFGKLWIRLANIHPTGNEKMSDMYGQMFWNFVANLVTAIALAIVYAIAATSFLITTPALCTGIICGLLVWAGFLVTSSSIEVIWMGKSRKLWLFEAFSSLMVMVAMGIIIAVV